MKMSLCNSFRLFVVSFVVVLSSIDASAVAFTLRRATGVDNLDLAAEESVVLENRRDLKQKDVQIMDKINNMTKNVTKEPPQSSQTDSYSQMTNIMPPQTIAPQETTFYDISTESSIPTTNTELQTTYTNSVLENVPTTHIPLGLSHSTEIDTSTNLAKLDTEPQGLNNPNELRSEKQELAQSDIIYSTLTTDKSKEQKSVTEPSYKLRLIPKWKKYTTIERKRTSAFTDDKSHKKGDRETIKEEEIINAESKHLRVALQDAVTSTDAVTLGHNSFVTQENLTNTAFNVTANDDILPISTVESIRAGFLNFSAKTKTVEMASEKETTDFKMNNNEPLRSMFETENPESDVLGDKNGNKIETQSVMSEDAIKEELLKEELINDTEENAQRQRENDDKNKIVNTELSNKPSDNFTQLNSSSDSLSVKPISADKYKNITLYAVSPNYKPMKKIEVLPPKQFVRDPDDNSWRNESLSSLGIVFKPKNSSKPFTQVLKNKTEIEWNNLSDKDSKNDLPDLKERLQKMAEKRKLQRKKIDSFGNIVYFDYEENGNSAENISNPVDHLSIGNTASVTDLQNSYLVTSSSANEEPQNIAKTVPSLTTLTSTTESVKENSYSTKKYKKFFNVPEYYDTTDEDDRDYINMAKIDLKKFTTSFRPNNPLLPSTIVTKPPQWLVNKKLPFNIAPERKATIQHFPPLTTQKVNINDYDNDFKLRVESFTTEAELPKHVLPVALDRPTAPATHNKQQDDEVHNHIANNYAPTNKPDSTKDSVSTRRPLTTDTGLERGDAEGFYDRGTYVIKHYRDFINEAARHSEYDKSIDYIPYTEAPAEGATKTDLVGHEKDKGTVSIDNTYDYETQFRKDVLQRFVDNFNQNSNRYRPYFPVLFNNSIVHGETPSGRDVASSRAFMRGLYGADRRPPSRRPCDPNCENVTVELSPAYELHYYVPEQEEEAEAAPRPATLPQYRL